MNFSPKVHHFWSNFSQKIEGHNTWTASKLRFCSPFFFFFLLNALSFNRETDRRWVLLYWTCISPRKFYFYFFSYFSNYLLHIYMINLSSFTLPPVVSFIGITCSLKLKLIYRISRSTENFPRNFYIIIRIFFKPFLTPGRLWNINLYNSFFLLRNFAQISLFYF